MTDQAIRAVGQLSASRLSWKRLRRLGLYCGLLVGTVGGTIFYMDGLSGILLRADGYVSRERVAVAPAFEGRIAQVLVRPGDHVEKGQKIAVVKSVAISRTLADLAAEKARLMSKIAQLQARRRVIIDTLPLAKSSAAQTATYLNDLSQARANGLTLNKSLQAMTSASLSANEHVAGLQAEQASLSVELDANRLALAQAASAYDDLSGTYAEGALYAPVSGDIGASVASAGQALSTGEGGGVADIYTGESFVLAYVPDSYLLNISEGQTVGVRARNEVVNGRIDRILPLTETLPNDLQAPNRMLERGRLVRVALKEPNQLPVDQRVQVTTCFQTDCHVGVVHAALERTHTILVQVTTCFQTDCHVEVLHAALKRTLTVLDRVFATLVGSKAKKPVQLGESAGGALATSFGWGSTK